MSRRALCRLAGHLRDTDAWVNATAFAALDFGEGIMGYYIMSHGVSVACELQSARMAGANELRTQYERDLARYVEQWQVRSGEPTVCTLRAAIDTCAAGDIAGGYRLLAAGLLAAEEAATAGEPGAQARVKEFTCALASYMKKWGDGEL